MGPATRLDTVPAELLGQIVRHFAEPRFKDLQTLDDWKSEYGSPWTARRRALQQLRLVCRRFCDLASPLLFSYLPISADPDSIDSANKIAGQPRLASGIRGVLVHTGLYSLSISESQEQHQGRVLSELGDYLGGFVRRLHDCDQGERGRARDDVGCLMRNYTSIAASWGVDVSSDMARMYSSMVENWGEAQESRGPEELGTVGPGSPTALEVFTEAHQAYRLRMSRQRVYVKSRAFSDNLIACLVRLPHLETLEMDAQRRAPMSPEAVLRGGDPETLARFIEYGHQGPWKAPDSIRDCAMASIMTILPCKLCDAGIRLRTLRLGSFPTALPLMDSRTGESHRLTAPPDHDDALMERLAAAAQTLDSVTLHIFFETNGYWKAFTEGFVRAVLSSPALCELDMLVPLPQKAIGKVATSTTAHQMGRILSARGVERLRRLSLTGLTLPEASLGSMLAGCWDARLDGVFLEDGLWANVVDRVMAAGSSDGRVGRRKVRLHRVKGGEMGHVILFEQVPLAQQLEYVSEGYGETEPIVLLMAQRYLAGDSTVRQNPFREYRGKASYFKCRKVLSP